MQALALFDFIGTQLAECYRELVVFSQVGADMSRFASVKHFTSWLGMQMVPIAQPA